MSDWAEVFRCGLAALVSVCHSKLSNIGDRLPISGLSTDVKMAAVMVTDVSLFVYFLWFSPRR